MEQSPKLTRLLQQLESETGIAFQITGSTMNETETAAKLKDLLAFCQTHDNRNTFLSRFFLGQLTEEELLRGIQHFHIKENAICALFLLESRQAYDPDVISVLSSLYSSGAETIIEMDSTHIAVIRQFKKAPAENSIRQAALHLIDTLEAEAMTSFCVSYDTWCDSFCQLADSYQKLHTAMRIGQIFYSSDRIFGYRELGLGKLLYHLPEDICRSYLRDHFSNIDYEDIDDETLHTIYTFFDSNLNIAECSRKLFLHRNTLVYRLDKIQKLTGLDIRKFDDAITCKIAMMLGNYLSRSHSS